MTTIIENFSADEHLAQVVTVLADVRDADPTYPPPADVGPTRGALREWLLRDEAIGRWVALLRDGVGGYVQLTAPHAYLLKHLEGRGYIPLARGGIAEVSQLFVSPRAARQGVGTRLFRHACEVAWAHDLQPALAVVSSSAHAVRLYTREGMRQIGTFDGVHGENHVFVDEERNVGGPVHEQ